MSRYIPIAIIRIEHTYYDSFMNRNVILEPTSDTRKPDETTGSDVRAHRHE